MGGSPRYEKGTVALQLGDKTYKLRATMKAADAIDRTFGGILPAMQEVGKLNGHAITQVVIIGIGTESKGGKEKLTQMIYDEGRTKVAETAAKFLNVLIDPTGESNDEDLEPAPGTVGNEQQSH